jgi:hypothetical protein
MEYVLATVDVPGQERNYYAGPVRKIGGRMAHKVTHSLDNATRFATAEAAEAMCKELGGGYRVVAAPGTK